MESQAKKYDEYNHYDEKGELASYVTDVAEDGLVTMIIVH